MVEELKTEALEKISKVLESHNNIMKQYNLMLLDLYERVAKLEIATQVIKKERR